MKIDVTQTGKSALVSIDGRIDSNNYTQLGQALNQLNYDGLDLTLDFSRVSYITSAGLRVLLICRKKLSRETMKLAHVSDAIRDIFDTTGFSDYFTILGEEQDESQLWLSCALFLKERARSSGDREILFQGDQAYTWADIDDCAQVIASDLARQGVRKGSHVAICGANSINWVITYYAIQKLNAIAILLNFNLKPEEIRMFAEIGDITHLCYGLLPGVDDYDAFLGQVCQDGCSIGHTYDIGSAIDFRQRIGTVPPLADTGYTADPDDPCMMIFTSGSTGRPKGVLTSSFNAMVSIRQMMDVFETTEADKICSFLPLFHIFGVGTALFASLLCNIPLYIPVNNRPETIIRLIDQEKCTMFHSVPTMFLAIAASPEFAPEKVASLRCSYIGGAPITEQQMNALCQLFPNNHFGNLYGMSEIAPISLTCYNDTPEHITRTIGKPVRNVELQIRDLATGQPCPVGVSGEITVRAENLLTSYYKLDIDKQAIDADGWLPTGDLGVLQEDGYVRLVGRVKELIIRAGENISPNEVASAISRLEGIADVKVIGIPDERLGEKVAAAIVLKAGASFDEDAARAELSTRLAKMKIPEIFLIYDAFPLLGSGKVDAVTIKKDLVQKANG